MTTIPRTKLHALYTHLLPGTPLTVDDLAALGISADLAVHYVRSGWLQRLARGVYCKPGDTLSIHGSLVLLERGFKGLHVGGKTALDWYGVRHYIAQRPVLDLYGWEAARLPAWFTERFPAAYHRKRIFEEQPEALLSVGPFGQRAGAPNVSSPERALLEVLSEIGVRESLQEISELVESTYSLRDDVLRGLLEKCTSVKTVRLCIQLGREHSLPWVSRLDPTQLPTGSNSHWVSQSDDGLLVLKP